MLNSWRQHERKSEFHFTEFVVGKHELVTGRFILAKTETTRFLVNFSKKLIVDAGCKKRLEWFVYIFKFQNGAKKMKIFDIALLLRHINLTAVFWAYQRIQNLAI